MVINTSAPQPNDWDVKSAAMAFVGKQWNVTPLYSVHFDSAIVGTGASYAFLRQQVVSILDLIENPKINLDPTELSTR